ncbi:MAG: hypothetical protein ACP5RS_01420 [Thermoplasmata archaeon]
MFLKKNDPYIAIVLILILLLTGVKPSYAQSNSSLILFSSQNEMTGVVNKSMGFYVYAYDNIVPVNLSSIDVSIIPNIQSFHYNISNNSTGSYSIRFVIGELGLFSIIVRGYENSNKASVSILVNILNKSANEQLVTLNTYISDSNPSPGSLINVYVKAQIGNISQNLIHYNISVICISRLNYSYIYLYPKAKYQGVFYLVSFTIPKSINYTADFYLVAINKTTEVSGSSYLFTLHRFYMWETLYNNIIEINTYNFNGSPLSNASLTLYGLPYNSPFKKMLYHSTSNTYGMGMLIFPQNNTYNEFILQISKNNFTEIKYLYPLSNTIEVYFNSSSIGSLPIEIQNSVPITLHYVGYYNTSILGNDKIYYYIYTTNLFNKNKLVYEGYVNSSMNGYFNITINPKDYNLSYGYINLVMGTEINKTLYKQSESYFYTSMNAGVLNTIDYTWMPEVYYNINNGMLTFKLNTGNYKESLLYGQISNFQGAEYTSNIACFQDGEMESSTIISYSNNNTFNISIPVGNFTTLYSQNLYFTGVFYGYYANGTVDIYYLHFSLLPMNTTTVSNPNKNISIIPIIGIAAIVGYIIVLSVILIAIVKWKKYKKFKDEKEQ